MIKSYQNALECTTAHAEIIFLCYINFSDNSVSQIESEYFDLPHGIGISGDGSRVFVTSSAMMGDYLHIIDTSTNDVINSIELGNGVTATGLAVMQSMCTDCD